MRHVHHPKKMGGAGMLDEKQAATNSEHTARVNSPPIQRFPLRE
jgi:hypothetical protein